jgi:short subunit dehydrogenase-like uncharacterized protein
MAGQVVLFGATGYTGRLVAEQMVARGMRPLLAARDRVKLAALAEELGGLDTAVADVERPASVATLVDSSDVLVTTVGPFTRWGGPALDAAISAGAHYIDSTGEPAFVRRVFEQEGPRAERARCALLTALAYDWEPGNLAGGLALHAAGAGAVSVRIGYFITGEVGALGMSGGTRASAAGALLEPGFAWRGGRLVTERGAARVASFEVAGRRRQGISVGSSEAFTLPRLHDGLRDVEVYLGWFGPASPLLAAMSVGMAGVRRVPPLKTGLESLLGRLVRGSTGGPDAEARARSGSEIVAEARSAEDETLAKVRLTGVDGYTFTGAFLAWAAERAARDEIHGTGALGPAEAFGLDQLEAGVTEAGIRQAPG